MEAGKPIIRYHTLDAWRGVACLMVVVAHCTFYEWRHLNPQSYIEADPLARILMYVATLMYVAVPIFFVISGYGISASVQSMIGRENAVKTFFKRRIRRVYPPLWIATLVMAVLFIGADALGWKALWNDGVSYGMEDPRSLNFWQWVGNITMTESWRHYFTEGDRRFVLAQLWTVCYEEQFYVLAALCLWFFPRRYFTFCIVITAVTLLVMPWQFVYPHLPIRGFFYDGHWLFFALGVLMYYRVAFASSFAKKAILGFFAATFVISVSVRVLVHLPAVSQALPIDPHVQDELKHFLMNCMAGTGISCVFVVVQRWDLAISKMRWMKPFAFLGTISYSIYLAHWPVARATAYLTHNAGIQGYWPTLLITVPLTLVLSVLAGWLFYLAVERYFLNQKKSPAAALKPVSGFVGAGTADGSAK